MVSLHLILPGRYNNTNIEDKSCTNILCLKPQFKKSF